MVAFLPVEFVAEQPASHIKLAKTEHSLYEYSSSTIVEVRDWILVTSYFDRREPKTKVLHKAISVLLPRIDESCLQGFSGITGKDLRVNCF